MQQAYTGAHHLERSTPILGLCHDVFTERFIFRLSFRGKQANRARLGNAIHETQRKKMATLCGEVFISKLRKFRLSFAIFQYSNPSFPYISYHPLQIFHTCEKIRGRADHRFIFELSSSQESASTQSVKVRKGNFATQD